MFGRRLVAQTISRFAGEMSDKYAKSVSAFHWPIEFPHIFARGGFDAVIGNPPWEGSSSRNRSFLHAKSPEIAAKKGDERKKAIVAVYRTMIPGLWSDFVLR